MIRFEPAPKPDGFAERVEARGHAWLSANSEGRPRDYWSEFKPALADAFRSLCGYSAMYEPVGTVDHFVSCQEDRTRAYDWSNYRFASGWLNASKQALRSHEVVVRQRREWYRMYQAGELTLDGLARKAPLIAAAVRKQMAT